MKKGDGRFSSKEKWIVSVFVKYKQILQPQGGVIQYFHVPVISAEGCVRKPHSQTKSKSDL